jgi:hypothetical protein
MSPGDIIAIVSVSLAGFVAMISLLGWIVRILMTIQTDLASMASEVGHLAGRIDRVERRVFEEFEGPIGRART